MADANRLGDYRLIGKSKKKVGNPNSLLGNKSGPGLSAGRKTGKIHRVSISKKK